MSAMAELDAGTFSLSELSSSAQELATEIRSWAAATGDVSTVYLWDGSDGRIHGTDTMAFTPTDRPIVYIDHNDNVWALR